MAHYNGSSLLMVICFTSTMSICALGVWRITLYVTEAAQARMAYAQVLKSTEGLLNMGIEIGIENYGQLLQEREKNILTLSSWLAQHGKKLVGELEIESHKEYLLIHALLKDGDTVRCALRCHLREDLKGNYGIEAWSIDTLI